MSRREDARKLWSLLLDIGDGQRKSRSEEGYSIFSFHQLMQRFLQKLVKIGIRMFRSDLLVRYKHAITMLSWKRQSAPASISASCVSILVIFINVFNGTIYMGNVLPPKLPEDRQCSTPLRSILAHGVREPGSLDYLKVPQLEHDVAGTQVATSTYAHNRNTDRNTSVISYDL